jgi:hypothetical protein
MFDKKGKREDETIIITVLSLCFLTENTNFTIIEFCPVCRLGKYVDVYNSFSGDDIYRERLSFILNWPP